MTSSQRCKLVTTFPVDLANIVMVTVKDYSREEINDNDACADEDVEPNVMNMDMLIE